MENENLSYYPDCRFFRGFIPCIYHKNESVHCTGCPHYAKVNEDILVIKLGAIGDVIRTTPLLSKIWKEHPKARIWWLTYSPEVLPSAIDRIMPFNLESIVTLKTVNFSVLINLDKDLQACALASEISADKKFGFVMNKAVPVPANELSENKFLTGLFDDVSQANRKSYLDEIFEICGWEFGGEEYILNYSSDIEWQIQNENKPVVGLNTGCGARWTSRLWKEENWLKLIKLLQQNGYYPVLLGGEQENPKNLKLAEMTDCKYFGYFGLQDFISLV